MNNKKEIKKRIPWNKGLNKEQLKKHHKKGELGNFGGGFYIYELPENLKINDRFETILIDRGIKWSDVYKKFGYDKAFASRIKRGIIIPKRKIRVKIAKEMNSDSLVFWRDEDLIMVYKWEDSNEEK